MTAGTESSTRWPAIPKDVGSFRVRPNLVDYDASCAAFSWDEARHELSGLPGGRGLNIAYEAVDRHAAGGHGGHEALRFVRADGSSHSLSYAELAEQTQPVRRACCAASASGAASASSRSPAAARRSTSPCWAPSRTPACSARCSPPSAPNPSGSGCSSGSGRALVTTRALYRRKIAQLRDSLPELRHVLLIDADGDPEPGTPTWPR